VSAIEQCFEKELLEAGLNIEALLDGGHISSNSFSVTASPFFLLPIWQLSEAIT